MTRPPLTAIAPEGWAPWLDPGEHLLWTGQPVQGLRLQRSDWFMIPFSIVWCGFVIAWETVALTTDGMGFFALFGLPFVAVGLFLLVGRFFLDAAARKRTRYALTDRRAIVATSLGGRRMISLPIGPGREVEYRPGREATIVFDRKVTPSRRRGRKRTGPTVTELGFERIAEGEHVHRLIRAIQNGTPVTEPA